MNRRLILAGGGSLLLGAAMLAAVTGATWRPVRALTNCDTNTAGLNAAEQNVVELLNAHRQQNGLAPVKVSPALSRDAAWMAEDMTAKGYFNHFEPGGRTPFQRAVDCGYPSQNIGENLAISSSGGGAMTLWKTSPYGHNENMLKPQWKVVGIGQAGGYWSMVLGAVDDSGSGAAPPALPTAKPTPTKTPGPNDPSALPIRRAMLQMVASE